MSSRRNKKPRGSRGSRHAPCIRDPQKKQFHELMIPLPPQEDKAKSSIQIREILDRLESVGYSSVALVHTVFGVPKEKDDRPEVVFADLPSESAKRKRSLRVFKRLHVVVENASDVAFFAPTEKEHKQKLLLDYDIVSISPRNDLAWQAACSTATMAEIITLDYTSGRGGIQLPFRMRPGDVAAAIERNIVFEILYAPAILEVPKRKALVQTARMFQLASLASKPKLILSAGDCNVMALRSPGDLVNIVQTVLRFDPSTANDSLSTNTEYVIERARQRRLGGVGGSNHVVDVVWGQVDLVKETIPKATVDTKAKGSNPKVSSKAEDAGTAGEETEDGFIRLT